MPDIDLGGNNLIVDGIKVGATAPGQAGTTLTGSEITLIDGITPGTVTASKAVVVDSSKNIATLGTVGSGAITVTSASANSLAVGPNGTTTPILKVDSSTSSAVAGLSLTGAATGGTVALAVTDSGSNANLTVNAKGTGTIGIGSVSTGAVTITPATTVTGVLTATGGVTTVAGLTSKSGTAVPASAGAIAAGSPLTCFSSGWKLWVTSDTPAFSATKGDLCINTGGSSSSTRLYVNNGTTNWVAITTAS